MSTFSNQHCHISRLLTFALVFELFSFPHAGNAAPDYVFQWSLFAPAQVRAEGSATVRDDEARVVQALPSTEDLEPAYTRRVLMTAYSSTPDQTDDTPFITANGTRVRDGIIAANFLRFGTRVKIPELYGDKVFMVTDRMHERFSDRMDIWMPTREAAREFGVKVATIEIY